MIHREALEEHTGWRFYDIGVSISCTGSVGVGDLVLTSLVMSVGRRSFSKVISVERYGIETRLGFLYLLETSLIKEVLAEN
jgi:hypothetical protein